MKVLNDFLTVLLNGQTFVLSSSISMKELISFLGLKESEIAIELNNQIVEKHFFQSCFINDLDKLEIVTIVGGG